MKRLLAVMLMLLVCLTGCSNGGRSYGPNDDITVDWKDGVIYMKGNPTNLTEYRGYTAKCAKDGVGFSFELSIDTAKDVTNITCNTQGILEENMEKYKGAFYYMEFLGTSFTMAKEIGTDTWAIAKTYLGNNPSTLAATSAYDAIEACPLTNMQVYCDFGKFVVGTEYDTLIVNQEGCVIEGILKVVKKEYNKGEPYTVTVGDTTISMMKAATEKYDYYIYDGFLIQLAKGLDVTRYVQFKAE